MSRDSNYTYIHMHASHHADLFEEFCRPPSSSTHPNSSTTNAQSNSNTNQQQPSSSEPEMIHIPGHFLPFEEIQLPPHLMPANPEDEDDVVPDMHAAFGIQRALGSGGVAGSAAAAGGEAGARGVARELVWRDLGMERLLETGGVAVGAGNGGVGGNVNARSESAGLGSGVGAGGRREGRRNPVLLMR